MTGVGQSVTEKYYKMTNPDAVASHIQSQLPEDQQQQQPGGQHPMMGMPQLPGMPQLGQMPNPMMPQMAR